MKSGEKLQQIFARHDPRRDALIPILQDIQAEYGYLPPEAMEAAAGHCRMHPVEVFGVSTFYAQFKFDPVGRNTLMVCQGTACHVMGGARILEEVQSQLGIRPGQTTPDGAFTLETVACIGACALAPAMVVNKDTHGRMKPEKVMEILHAARNDNS
ncbi:MAG TPA: NADH-quinone oxidoreductase subunit NuoE [Syntrophobacteraceae bacterium]|nr:NADH-quinone oxidoreductase subunit NuoE [Syntrophobacteraceae bacterium]